MLQKLLKFLEVAQKIASCPKVVEQLVDRAKCNYLVAIQHHNVLHQPIQVFHGSKFASSFLNLSGKNIDVPSGCICH